MFLQQLHSMNAGAKQATLFSDALKPLKIWRPNLFRPTLRPNHSWLLSNLIFLFHWHRSCYMRLTVSFALCFSDWRGGGLLSANSKSYFAANIRTTNIALKSNHRNPVVTPVSSLHSWKTDSKSFRSKTRLKILRLSSTRFPRRNNRAIFSISTVTTILGWAF